jgi:hypothetical protein
MRSNAIKHLGFVLMLLPLCALFMGSNCNSKNCWETAKDGLPDEYMGYYKVTEVWDYSSGEGKEYKSGSFVESNTGQFGGSHIKIEHLLPFGKGDPQVSISDKIFKLYQNGTLMRTIEIDSLTEVLSDFQKCKQEQGMTDEGPITVDCDGCGGYDYQDYGNWGFPGVGMEDMSVNYRFDTGWYMQMRFTDTSDSTRNFILFCVRKAD